MKEISVVIPVYKSEECIPELTKQISDALKDFNWELILVNDCSPDNSWTEIKKVAAENNNITRQAVRDIIKKGEKKLFEYEEKLLFMKRMLNQEETLKKVLSELTKIQKTSSDKKVEHILETVKKELNCLV